MSMRNNYNESDLLELVKTMLVPASAFRSVTNEESLYILALRLIEINNDPIDENIRNNFMYQLIEKRLQLYDYSMSEHAITLIASLSTTPGIAVTYMTYLQYLSSKYDIKKYSVSDICMRAIPYGVLRSDVLEKFWDAQKAKDAPLCNMVDDIDCIKYIAGHEEVC